MLKGKSLSEVGRPQFIFFEHRKICEEIIPDAFPCTKLTRAKVRKGRHHNYVRCLPSC